MSYLLLKALWLFYEKKVDKATAQNVFRQYFTSKSFEKSKEISI